MVLVTYTMGGTSATYLPSSDAGFAAEIYQGHVMTQDVIAHNWWQLLHVLACDWRQRV